ncbi:HD-GYP domain-containing protein [Psychromonas antarctica]|jgi:putative nucleotidyltransferase with HDIG domain|uniref:HD-GYP domain-containing protein n=1 Tax=Psychromonas antarctica TaxID=67573 RepID=UPI001EE95884|nr:HD-GYP domain-containing protein [Psychromonas antarctica]MCG6200880.1 HD-GYP domain-containing protein [Psychromonas antarctica]
MLKKIKVTQLCKGMYINDLNCGWLDHPFTLNRFKVDNETAIRRIIAAGVKVVEIDTEKGDDVFIEELKTQQVPFENVLSAALSKKITAQQELGRARVAYAEAGQFITEMMANVKMGQHVELEKVTPVINKMSVSILRNPNALLGLSRIRLMDKYTFEHSVGFSVLMMVFAKSMGLSLTVIKQVGMGGLLHDIGKTLTPSHILNKPGKLTEQEFVVMKKHVVGSRIILEKSQGFSKIAMEIVAQHHEKFDGKGYPLGLKGEQISLYGQMAAIVDVYDALTADRCYHKGSEPSEVLRLMLKWRGSHFNPELVNKFIQSVGIYPVGSLVLLSNDYLAKVVEIDGNMLKPQVELILNSKKRCYVPRKIINLSDHPDIKILTIESHAKWNVQQ